MRHRLTGTYRKLYRHFGPQGWWPASTPFEVMVGAILTQNTSWQNVERAIAHLKKARSLSLKAMMRLSEKKLARLIRPAGYYNIKARRLKNFLRFIQVRFGGSLQRMGRVETKRLRRELLGVNGIGPETADSILLYAFSRPVFVVDAYTRRWTARHGLAAPDALYEDLQKMFMEGLPADTALFNEYHALIVRLGKDYCRKTQEKCAACPIHDEKC
ncbi:MAG: endonuclease III domain-containing protein [Candidatus Omnitrophica bacterium]|nr:endonuclease III domain-containing protein [Candidatus Omnitrophota bacterium]MDD5574109.1 endonuclease III domain-containing protein [Candidatus Omnitrophota bacterium]